MANKEWLYGTEPEKKMLNEEGRKVHWHAQKKSNVIKPINCRLDSMLHVEQLSQTEIGPVFLDRLDDLFESIVTTA